jgi:hypothetical protein
MSVASEYRDHGTSSDGSLVHVDSIRKDIQPREFFPLHSCIEVGVVIHAIEGFIKNHKGMILSLNYQ